MTHPKSPRLDPSGSRGGISTPPTSPRDIAVVDDDAAARAMLRYWLEGAGHPVAEFATGRAFLDACRTAPAAACVDLGLEDMSGLEVLRRAHAMHPDLPMVVVTAELELGTVVDAMRAGARDYVTKPLDEQRVVQAVHRALTERDDEKGVEPASARQPELPSGLVGLSAPMLDVARHIQRVAASDVPVCIFGESGTGKELVARAIHAGGKRKKAPFVAINCAAIPDSLHEAELFGHERGAFTGAMQQHKGRFEQADGGTLFLDEVGEMSAATQASLLRALQERTIRRVGGAAEVPVDIRVVCATHRNLRREVEAARFREDLYFRLVVYPIVLPPLRERPEDVEPLALHFASRIGGPKATIAPAALSALRGYAFPGNVRELQNIIHRSLLAGDHGRIELEHLPREVQRTSVAPPPAARPRADEPREPREPTPLSLRELEDEAIKGALEACGGSVTKAAKMLGIGRATLYRRLAAKTTAS